MAGRNQWKAADYYIGAVVSPTMFVDGSGLSGINGTYPDQGTNNGKRLFFKSGGDSTHSAIRWHTTNAWQMLNASAAVSYSSPEDVPTPDLVKVWTGSTDNPVVLPYSTSFRDFDISGLSDRIVQRYVSSGVRTTPRGGSPWFFFDSAKWPMLVVANHPMAEQGNFYYRRGLFIPSGNVYFRQRWKHPPALADIAAWAVDAAYAAGALVKYGGHPYSSRVDGNLGNVPSYSALNSNRYWKRVDVVTNIEPHTGGATGPGDLISNWDAARYSRYLKPTIQRVSCTPNVPVVIGLPPVGEIWMISDDQDDFPIEYPYEVATEQEMALRAVLSGIGGLDRIKNAAMTDAGLIANISRFAAATPTSAAARVFFGSSPRSLDGNFSSGGSSFRRTLRQVGGTDQ